MRKLLLLALALIAFGALPKARGQTEIQVVPQAADAKIYGDYPLAYKEIITRWLATILADPESAVVDWTAEPRAGELIRKKQRFVGYIVDFKVNARNIFGAPTGKQRYEVIIRNGAVVWGGRPRI